MTRFCQSSRVLKETIIRLKKYKKNKNLNTDFLSIEELLNYIGAASSVRRYYGNLDIFISVMSIFPLWGLCGFRYSFYDTAKYKKPYVTRLDSFQTGFFMPFYYLVPHCRSPPANLNIPYFKLINEKKGNANELQRFRHR